ncbi:hypothetical protein QBC38DRAFT_40330 [Podospora fimiseda]|uniref:BZIP domain-containing protein n=1 Tax=Podospora fimiseda TaxID=252190 RepID=A0AAN7H411_9PEZI|nr:hypothetical protein QBC38DRAFT_40330 [Podospora fimiseda]
MYQHPQDQDYEVDYTGVYSEATQYYWDEEGADQVEDNTNQAHTPRGGTQRSGSETEREGNMSSHSSKSSGSGSPGKGGKSRSKKSDDWSEVTEPEERRRIQNRIAQRKFREKAREQRDRAQRDVQNQQHAGSSYHIAGPDELQLDDGGDLSGLPWGGLNMRHVVARGHASASASAGSDHYAQHQQYYTQQPHQGTSAMYSMNPYATSGAGGGYLDHSAAMPMDMSGAGGAWPSPDMSSSGLDADSMSMGGGYGYESSYGGGYAGDGHHM